MKKAILLTVLVLSTCVFGVEFSELAQSWEARYGQEALKGYTLTMHPRHDANSIRWLVPLEETWKKSGDKYMVAGLVQIGDKVCESWVAYNGMDRKEFTHISKPVGRRSVEPKSDSDLAMPRFEFVLGKAKTVHYSEGLESKVHRDSLLPGMQKAMTKYPELYSIVKEEDAEVSGVRCLVFAYSEPYAEEDSTTLISKVARRLWIDPNTALIMKMENYRGDKRAGLMMEVLSTSVSKGLVYPKKFAITFSGKEKDKCLYEVTSFVPNPALKDSDFSKSFPSGTRVIDQELGISYIQP